LTAKVISPDFMMIPGLEAIIASKEMESLYAIIVDFFVNFNNDHSLFTISLSFA